MSTPQHDPAFLRGLTQSRLSRRDALRISGLSAAALALAACGVKGSGTGNPTASVSPPAPDAVAKFWAGKTKHGKVNFANWPLYMDPKKPELATFTKETGIDVTYKEVINDMPEWFGKVQPQLSAGKSIGYDIMVITNGINFSQYVRSGFFAPLDHAKMPNFAANAAASYKNETFDPGNAYSMPWASGMTGIAYDPKHVKEPITKLADLWNPAYKNKIGMMKDSQELANFGLLVLGIDPAKSTEDDWNRAAAKLQEQKATGNVRNYYGNDYADALTSGEIWIAQAWSGDVFQKNLDGAGLKFVVPDEGGNIWTDNMTIPITADNPVDAMMLMDFFYRPEIAASLTEFIDYVTPVPAAKDIITADAAKASGADKDSLLGVAGSPLVFPSEADLAKLHSYVEFKTVADQKKFQNIFTGVTSS